MLHRALLLTTVLSVIAIALFVACGGNGGPGSGGGVSVAPPNAAFVDTSLSDPTTCSAPQGPYSHIYVTIRDVQVSTSATAASGDSSFVDLTPNLKTTPVQIDLLGAANNSCFLATLGSKTQLTAGSYQQIRVYLLDNSSSTKPTGNQCGTTAVNCVVIAADSSVKTLTLSSESQTGIKIPPGQIAGGAFTIAAGASKDLNIDFDACASVVIVSNNTYRLKPVLHAGEVSTTSTSISGKLVDKSTNAAIVGGKAVVALEQKDASGIDRVIMQTVADSTGAFTFCPVPAGTYDVVAAAVNGAGVGYAATVVTTVQPGASLGNVQMAPQAGTNTAPATITGLVTTAGGTAGISTDISVSALSAVVIGGNSLTFTVPLAQQSSATASLATAASSSSLTCAANTFCANYTLSVPATAATVAVFNPNGTTYTSSTAAANYAIEGHAFTVSSGGTDSCSPAALTTSPISVTAGATTNAPTIAFVGCT